MLVSAALVTTQVKAVENDSPWSSTAELGLITTTGNTETQTITLKIGVTHEEDVWRHTGNFEGYGVSSEDSSGVNKVSAERYKLLGKSDYKFNEHDYAFGSIGLEDDRFSGFEYESTISGGYGRKLVNRDDVSIDVEIGPGVRLFKVDGNRSDAEALLRLAGKYWLQISENSTFTQDLTIDHGKEITAIGSVSAVQANINGSLGLKFTFTLRNKSEVPVATENTDTEAVITLVYTF